MPSPYNQLHIYYIRGRLAKESGDAGSFGRDFIGNWEEDNTTFLFFQRPSQTIVTRLLIRQPHLELMDKFDMPYEDWHGGPLEAMRVAGFVIRPPWQGTPVLEHEIPILLDPGVVFGAGNHPTTRDCLTALELILEKYPVSSALDLGTGTGVLAIAAAKLKCQKIIAVDNNFLAAKTALQNIRHNNIGRNAYVCCGNAETFMDISADLLIANIHFDVMRAIANHPGFLRKKYFILSGLLRSEARLLMNQFSQSPVEILHEWVKDDVWHTITGLVCGQGD